MIDRNMTVKIRFELRIFLQFAYQIIDLLYELC